MKRSRFYGKTTTSPIPNRSVRTVRAPIGVCAAVMPFNSPLAGIAWKVFPALLCGNAVVAKSHELTPYTAVVFGQLLKEAGLPRGLYSALQGYGPEVGDALIRDERIGVVSFTGSTKTGKLIQKTVSDRRVLAKVCLELGGKNPFVVCDDADLPLATEHAINSAFIDAGQRCASGSRIIVFRHVYDDFRQALVKRAEAVKVGSGPNDDCGPVISRESRDRILKAVQAAVSRGAKVLTGGTAVDTLGAGYYITPTVLDNVALDDELAGRALRAGDVPVSRQGLRRGDQHRQLDELRPHRRDSHVQHQPHRGVHRATARPRLDQRRDLRLRTAHAFWRREELRQRLPRTGHRSARRTANGRRSSSTTTPPAYERQPQTAHLFPDDEPRATGAASCCSGSSTSIRRSSSS